jgi:hypothetical protein
MKVPDKLPSKSPLSLASLHLQLFSQELLFYKYYAASVGVVTCFPYRRKKVWNLVDGTQSLREVVEWRNSLQRVLPDRNKWDAQQMMRMLANSCSSRQEYGKGLELPGNALTGQNGHALN